MAGWNINNVKLRFPNENLGIRKENELVEIYNKCSIGLVLSATNCSLLPDELMACGCVPVINRGNNNEWNVKDKLNGIVTELSPHAVAHTIKRYLDNANELQEIRNKGVTHVNSFNFEQEVKNIEEFIYNS